MLKQLIAISLLIFSSLVEAGEAAKVIRLRGYATQLSPGAKDARVVTLGQKIFEDTSILTKPKSFVVLEFADGARLSVGPDSKLVVTKARGDGAGIVSLLKGKLRSSITPSSDNDDKYIIRTRTAAMGVRGTDFQTSYNPDNRATSLVTFKGRVAMARLDTSVHELEGSHADKVLVSRDEKGEPTVEQAPKTSITRTEELYKVLRSKDVVTVENGQYAGAVTGLTRPTEPVVVNPIQLTLMYKNDQLAPKKDGEKLAQIDFSKIKHQGSPDGFYDAKTGKFAPRAGGFVDPDTALYIPPKEDSVLDPDSNIYIPKDVGFVNKDTGDYVPPKGLILDPKNGFVPKAQDSTLVAQAGQMNMTMAKDVLLKDIEEEEVPIMRPNKRERISRAMVFVSFGPGNEKHSVSNDTISGSFDNDGEGAFSIQIGHDQAGENEWQAITRLGIRNVDFGDTGSINKQSETLWSIGAGVRHSLSPRLAASGLISLEQTFIFNHPEVNNVTTQEWSRFTIPTLTLALESEFFRTNRFAMIADAGLVFSLPKSKADVESKLGTGFFGKLGAEYWTSRRMTVGGSFFLKQLNYELESNRFTSEDQISQSGLVVSIAYFY